MQDELVPLQRTAILKSLRDLFNELGGSLSPRVLAEEAVTRGAIPDNVLVTCQLRGVTELCRLALKAKTENGCRFAAPTSGDENDDEWKQLELFTYQQAEMFINRQAKAVLADYQELRRLHQWCMDKFGKAPEIPQLNELSEA